MKDFDGTKMRGATINITVLSFFFSEILFSSWSCLFVFSSHFCCLCTWHTVGWGTETHFLCKIKILLQILFHYFFYSIKLNDVSMYKFPVKASSSSSLICETTGPKPLPKRFRHIVRSRASSINWQYPLLSLRSSSSFLRLLPRLLVTSICPFIFLVYIVDKTENLWET